MKNSEYDFSLKPDILRLTNDVEELKNQIQQLFKRIEYLNNENINSIQPSLREIKFLLAEIENFNEEKK